MNGTRCFASFSVKCSLSTKLISMLALMVELPLVVEKKSDEMHSELSFI